MKRALLFICSLALLCFAGPAWPYPLDGYAHTGIARLEADRLVQAGKLRGRWLPKGALLSTAEVDLRLSDKPGFALPPVDPEFSSRIVALLGEEADRYALAVLDLSDPAHPRFAEHRGHAAHNPGSVGKLLIVLGVFQALADIYPDDPQQRLRVLRDSAATADHFIATDHHKVPFWRPGEGAISYRPLREGDRASLYSYLDWMLSASSNAAASMVLRELLMLVHFGRDYPVAQPVAERFWRETPKRELSALLGRALHEPVPRNGLDPKELRQGGFFTWKGKQLVPGTSSHATPRMLLEYLLKLETGRLVDEFSSREIKRLLYMTERRIRYASSPALHEAAVYFKSGSLYRCRPEPGFVCKKYHGNVENLLNSVAIVEYPAREPRLFYLVVMMSDVLRKNSAVVHQSFGTRLQRLIEADHRPSEPGR
ncbi:hypothetical protein DESUT3_19810 [Desulfuromonas versatilis]|uniref:Beta-lactamase class A catalytic domain-containing protein n=1 Tax=Desulfuromonas versatilis TaxID=2802975 RepID=A0ABM8HRK3_9BACT|nr:serine hydrolase [Desulfuromonas versatilis]BCR04912.1 hypothetical protein DESUT3_19810 [Desulfuromonas versatilis]